MKITIVCSLSSIEICDGVVKILESQGVDVSHPFEDQIGSLYRIQRIYLKKIEEADIVLAIPKTTCMNEACSDEAKTEIISVFGESTSYEIAYARHIGKPVIIWGEGAFGK